MLKNASILGRRRWTLQIGSLAAACVRFFHVHMVTTHMPMSFHNILFSMAVTLVATKYRMQSASKCPWSSATTWRSAPTPPRRSASWSPGRSASQFRKTSAWVCPKNCALQSRLTSAQRYSYTYCNFYYLFYIIINITGFPYVHCLIKDARSSTLS